MPVTLTSLSDLAALQADTVIDVRSSAEFAEDHLPGAINLPVLSDAERAEVGTIYVQDSAFRARRIGAALVAANAARHLQGPLADKDGSWQPLVYCWRGGQRSASFAAILTQVGWRTQVLTGGYRSYRRIVAQALYDDDWPTPLTLLDGNTGTAKTELLHLLAARGVQTLDLEGLARHRGSIFGPVAEAQPSQKAFESAIAGQLAGFDPARPVVIEAESSKIGDLLVPPSLWKAMQAAPRLEVAAPLGARAEYLTRAYADLEAAPDRVHAQLDRLVPFHGHEVVARWHNMVEARDGRALAEDLMRVHYDPRYARSRGRSDGAQVERLETETLGQDALDALATKIAARIR